MKGLALVVRRTLTEKNRSALLPTRLSYTAQDFLVPFRTKK
jgi:hypothetical protein